MKKNDSVYAFDSVQKLEAEYIEARKRWWHDQHGVKSTENKWGLALSGGGIRSATLCLGVMQALSKSDSRYFPSGCMGNFDYLSTVSGGGYIGSSLTTLMTKSGKDEKGDCSMVAGNFPFTELHSTEYSDFPQLSVMHQLHHFRKSGNYLAEQKKISSRYFQRLVGTAMGGAVYNIAILSILYVSFVLFLQGFLVHILNDGLSSVESSLTTLGFVSKPAGHRLDGLQLYLSEIWSSISLSLAKGPWGSGTSTEFLTRSPYYQSIIVGMVLGLSGCFMGWMRFGSGGTSESQKVESKLSWYQRTMHELGESRRSQDEKRTLITFNSLLIAAFFCLIGFAKSYGLENSWISAFGHGILWIPMSVMLGATGVVFIASIVLESALDASSQHRVFRSYLATIRGNCLTFLGITMVTPVVLIALFSLSAVPLELFLFSVFTSVFGVWGVQKMNPVDGSLSKIGNLLKKHPKITIGLAALITIVIPFAPITRLLMVWNVYSIGGAWGMIVAGCIMLLMLCCVTYVVDSNAISPFRFYRDRISAAYLKTSRTSYGASGFATTLRDDEEMKLVELGDRRGPNGVEPPQAPYHLITACLNIGTARRILRADTKSTHFLLSKYSIGSEETGYTSTPTDMSVANSIAISGAAASSIAGYHSSFGQRFFSTLFNIRLGQWILSPEARARQESSTWKRPIWLWYLIKEILGSTSETGKRLNVSDGGHTGDNLGLLPLLQRRVDTIVVVDAECDPEYLFGSLNHAIRLANVELNVTVDIDLDNIKPRTDGEVPLSNVSVVKGTIYYPELLDKKAKKGEIFYCKSSISRGAKNEQIPAHVDNYNRRFVEFPHQSTADQFFDPEQFEAYRALGVHIGYQARLMLTNQNGVP